jgi:cysteine desulfurase
MTSSTPRPLYFDYQSTTPLDPRVLEKMLPFWTEKFGNPHSRSHAYGWEAEEGVEEARRHVAALIGADPREIIFTSGATESNNMAIKGAAYFWKEHKRHVVTCQTEHKCVLDSCRHLEEEGFRVTYLPVSSQGHIDLKALEQALTDDTVLVSLMAVNNEIGIIHPLAEIGQLCRQRGVYFHTDAAQAAGKIGLDVETMKIDLLSLSAHKIYGPKGVGALYVRRKPRVRLVPLINGGGQERGLRSGTLAPALCAGFGEACRLAMAEETTEGERIQALNRRFYTALTQGLPEIFLNGDPEKRVPHNLNLSFAYVEGEGMMMGIKDIAVSSGSACTSSSLESSYVLQALGVPEELAHTSLRISLGRFTTQEEVDQAANQIIASVNRLRDMSPLYEMAQEGIDLRSIAWAAH